jgi:hypothetical protein
MNIIGGFVGFSRIYSINEMLTARRLYKSFGVKGLSEVFRGQNNYRTLLTRLRRARWAAQTKILGLVTGNSAIIFFKADLHGPCSTVY